MTHAYLYFLSLLAARTVIVYFFVIFGLRLLGKRQLGQMHIYDVALLMALANVGGVSRGDRIETADLGIHTQRTAAQTASQSLDEMSLETVEAILVRKALARVGGNVSQAAEALGLSRGALYRRIEKYGL